MIGEGGTYDTKQAADKRLRKRTLAFKDYYPFLSLIRKGFTEERLSKLIIENEFKGPVQVGAESNGVETVDVPQDTTNEAPTTVNPPEEGILGKRSPILNGDEPHAP